MRRFTALPLALLVGVGATVLQLPVRGADAAAVSSAKTVRWGDQAPRVPADDVPAVRNALKDFEVTISQSEDLLNQTVEVSWKGGATTGNGTFLALMQCWSDGPTISPTREQCAFGGADAESAGDGLSRTRGLGRDSREKSYRDDGTLSLLTVNNGDPPKAFADTASIVVGTSAPKCPSGTSSYATRIVAPRVSGLGTLVVEGPKPGVPPSMTRVVSGFTRTYPAVSRSFTLRELAEAKGLTHLPKGVYRTELACYGQGASSELARFVGYLEATATPGTWGTSSHPNGVYVPFDPLGDTPDTQPTDPYERNEVLEYLKPRSTNEIPLANNNPAGGGSVFMEMLTDLEAQHLGCGRVDGSAVRSCWLVAVPRWLGEPDGGETLVNGSSPLSQTNWDRRVEVPLRFAPVASGCRIGSGLKQIVSHDSALTALRSWQPTFCGDSRAAISVLGPLQDFAARVAVAQPNRMAVVGVPEAAQPTHVVAPLATSAVVVGFSVDRVFAYGTEDYVHNGTRARSMNLTPRLLAKLLTQSYDSGAAPNGGKASGYNGAKYSGFDPVFTPARNFPVDNPRTIYGDPEFLRHNPDYAWAAAAQALRPQDMADVLVTASDTDAYQVLWQWITGDSEAKAFLEGQPDEHGMRVNPYYKEQLTEATSSFPLFDPTCADVIGDPRADGFPLLCQTNNHPRVDDDTDAAQAAVRGDTKRSNVLPLGYGAGVTGYRPEPRQPQGERAMLVITTSAVAERYGLPTARLRNTDGEFVAATVGAMSVAREQMPERVDGVLVPKPQSVSGGGYPLTAMSYAVVDVAAATQAQREAFATILEYTGGAGQAPGTAIGKLPAGYAPLSPRLTAQTKQAAATLRDPSELLPPSPVPGPAGTPVTGPGTTAPLPSSPLVPGPVGASDPSSPVGPAPAATQGAVPSGRSQQVVVHAAATAGAATSAAWLVPALALLALLAALSSRVLTVLGRTTS